MRERVDVNGKALFRNVLGPRDLGMHKSVPLYSAQFYAGGGKTLQTQTIINRNRAGNKLYSLVVKLRN